MRKIDDDDRTVITLDKRAILRQTVETHYVETDTSLRALASKYPVSYPTLRRWSKDGDWKRKKAEFLREAQKRATRKRPDAVDFKAKTLSIQQRLAVSTVTTAAHVLSARNRALRDNPENKRALAELREIVEIQCRLDDLVLLTIGVVEESTKPAVSDYDVRIGDRIGNGGQTRVDAKHFDDQGREVDNAGNLIH